MSDAILVSKIYRFVWPGVAGTCGRIMCGLHVDIYRSRAKVLFCESPIVVTGSARVDVFQFVEISAMHYL